jgi:hypothetical protein
MRQSAEFVFALKMSADGAPWIALQPKYEGLAQMRGELGLDLYPGTSLEEAKHLVRFLNSNIKAVSYGPRDGPPD